MERKNDDGKSVSARRGSSAREALEACWHLASELLVAAQRQSPVWISEVKANQLLLVYAHPIAQPCTLATNYNDHHRTQFSVMGQLPASMMFFELGRTVLNGHLWIQHKAGWSCTALPGKPPMASPVLTTAATQATLKKITGCLGVGIPDLLQAKQSSRGQQPQQPQQPVNQHAQSRPSPYAPQPKQGHSNRCFKVLLAIVMCILALVGLITGIVLSTTSSSTSDFNGLLFGSFVVLLFSGLCFLTVHFFCDHNEGRRPATLCGQAVPNASAIYSLGYEIIASLGLTALTAGLYMMLLSLGDQGIWLMVLNVLLSGVVALLGRRYFKVVVPTLSADVPPSLKQGGVVAWTVVVLNLFVVAWTGLSAWPHFLESATSTGGVYGGFFLLCVLAVSLAADSNHGLVYSFSVLAALITAVAWHIALGQNDHRPTPALLFVLILAACAALAHHNGVRPAWHVVQCTMAIGFAAAYQFIGSLREWAVDLAMVGAPDARWEDGTQVLVLLALLLFIPAFVRGRCPLLPGGLALCASFLQATTLRFVLWPTVLVLLAVYAVALSSRTSILPSSWRLPLPAPTVSPSKPSRVDIAMSASEEDFDGDAESDMSAGASVRPSAPPEEASDAPTTGQRAAAYLQICNAALPLVGWVVHTYSDTSSSEGRLGFVAAMWLLTIVVTAIYTHGTRALGGVGNERQHVQTQLLCTVVAATISLALCELSASHITPADLRPAEAERRYNVTLLALVALQTCFVGAAVSFAGTSYRGYMPIVAIIVHFGSLVLYAATNNLSVLSGVSGDLDLLSSRVEVVALAFVSALWLFQVRLSSPAKWLYIRVRGTLPACLCVLWTCALGSVVSRGSLGWLCLPVVVGSVFAVIDLVLIQSRVVVWDHIRADVDAANGAVRSLGELERQWRSVVRSSHAVLLVWLTACAPLVTSVTNKWPCYVVAFAILCYLWYFSWAAIQQASAPNDQDEQGDVSAPLSPSNASKDAYFLLPSMVVTFSCLSAALIPAAEAACLSDDCELLLFSSSPSSMLGVWALVWAAGTLGTANLLMHASVEKRFSNAVSALLVMVVLAFLVGCSLTAQATDGILPFVLISLLWLLAVFWWRRLVLSSSLLALMAVFLTVLLRMHDTRTGANKNLWGSISIACQIVSVLCLFTYLALGGRLFPIGDVPNTYFRDMSLRNFGTQRRWLFMYLTSTLVLGWVSTDTSLGVYPFILSLVFVPSRALLMRNRWLFSLSPAISGSLMLTMGLLMNSSSDTTAWFGPALVALTAAHHAVLEFVYRKSPPFWLQDPYTPLTLDDNEDLEEAQAAPASSPVAHRYPTLWLWSAFGYVVLALVVFSYGCSGDCSYARRLTFPILALIMGTGLFYKGFVGKTSASTAMRYSAMGILVIADITAAILANAPLLIVCSIVLFLCVVAHSIRSGWFSCASVERAPQPRNRNSSASSANSERNASGVIPHNAGRAAEVGDQLKVDAAAPPQQKSLLDARGRGASYGLA